MCFFSLSLFFTLSLSLSLSGRFHCANCMDEMKRQISYGKRGIYAESMLIKIWTLFAHEFLVWPLSLSLSQFSLTLRALTSKHTRRRGGEWSMSLYAQPYQQREVFCIYMRMLLYQKLSWKHRWKSDFSKGIHPAITTFIRGILHFKYNTAKYVRIILNLFFFCMFNAS